MFRNSDEWQGVEMVVPVYREKSRIYVLSAAPNFYLVQLAELLRCSGRDWLRPGGAARAGALLVRPSLRRAPAGLERCGSGCPALLVAASLLPGAAALALGSVRGVTGAPRALWRRRRDRGAPAAARNAAAAAWGRVVPEREPCRRSRRHFCVLLSIWRLLAGKKAHFCRFQPRKWGLTHF